MQPSRCCLSCSSKGLGAAAVPAGGIASGLRRKDVFAFTAGPQLYPDVPGEAQYAGLALCLPAAKGSEGGGAAPGLKAGAFNSRGLGGVGPVFYDVGLVRGVGSVVDEEGDGEQPCSQEHPATLRPAAYA